MPVGPRLLKHYQSTLEAFFEEIEGFCKSYGVKYIRLVNTTPFREVVFQTLIARGYLR